MQSLGRIGYDAYWQQSGGVSLVSGAKLPPWEELKPEISAAWDAAAAAMCSFLSVGKGTYDLAAVILRKDALLKAKTEIDLQINILAEVEATLMNLATDRERNE